MSFKFEKAYGDFACTTCGCAINSNDMCLFLEHAFTEYPYCLKCAQNRINLEKTKFQEIKELFEKDNEVFKKIKSYLNNNKISRYKMIHE